MNPLPEADCAVVGTDTQLRVSVFHMEPCLFLQIHLSGMLQLMHLNKWQGFLFPVLKGG